ncbi:tetratricopeptide repeat protein [Candidatus Dependentiae bacterium]|nr:tetratricopeptide repeat protein [Candidatus Dependentiae bacterium]
MLLRPYYGKAWFNLGRLYLEQKKNEEAWSSFVKATQGDLDIPNAFDILGQVGLQLGKYEQAAIAFEETLRRSPGIDLPRTKFNLANAYFLTQRLDEARAIFKQISDQYPQDNQFSYNLAETMFMQGEYASAYEIFNKLTAFPDASPNAPMRAAQCIERQGDVKSAFAYVTEKLASTNSDKVINILRPEHSRLELAAHLKDSGGVLSAENVNYFLSKNGQDGVA